VGDAGAYMKHLVFLPGQNHDTTKGECYAIAFSGCYRDEVRLLIGRTLVRVHAVSTYQLFQLRGAIHGSCATAKYSYRACVRWNWAKAMRIHSISATWSVLCNKKKRL